MGRRRGTIRGGENEGVGGNIPINYFMKNNDTKILNVKKKKQGQRKQKC